MEQMQKEIDGLQRENDTLQREVEKANETSKNLEAERDFYYGKLRKIEVACNENPEDEVAIEIFKVLEQEDVVTEEVL